MDVKEFFSLIDDHFFQHHLVHYRGFTNCCATFKRGEIAEHTKLMHKCLFDTKKCAACHIQIEVSDDPWKYYKANGGYLFDRNIGENAVEVGPHPPFYWLFRQEFAKSATRLLVDFSTQRDGMKSEFEDVLFGDQRLVGEFIRWLAEPLPPRQSLLSSNSSQINDETTENFNNIKWQPPTLAGCERILHIGNEESTLNMALIIDFIQTLVNVCSKS